MKKYRPPRPPLKIQLEAALYQLGLDPNHVRLDHHPALAFREYDESTGKYTPDANDPRYLQWLTTAAHANKTNGIRGDIACAAKIKRLTKKQADFRARILAKDTGDGIIPRRKWPTRKLKG